jgi:hypothetical protein
VYPFVQTICAVRQIAGYSTGAKSALYIKNFDALSSSEAGDYLHLSRFAKIWQKLRPEWANPRDKLTRDLINLAWGKTPPDAAE